MSWERHAPIFIFAPSRTPRESPLSKFYQVIHTHELTGDRYPLLHFANNIYEVLTRVIHETYPDHYKLGHFVRSRYKGELFNLDPQYRPLELSARWKAPKSGVETFTRLIRSAGANQPEQRETNEKLACYLEALLSDFEELRSNLTPLDYLLDERVSELQGDFTQGYATVGEADRILAKLYEARNRLMLEKSSSELLELALAGSKEAALAQTQLNPKLAFQKVESSEERHLRFEEQLFTLSVLEEVNG